MSLLKIGMPLIILSSITLFDVLFIVLIVPTSPVWPIAGAVGVIMLLWGIFEVKGYTNIKVYVILAGGSLCLGSILSYINSSMAINEGNRWLYQIHIVVTLILMSFVIYAVNLRLKSTKKSHSTPSTSLDNLDKVILLTLIPIFLIMFSRGLYHGIRSLSLILVIIGVIIYIPCFWWLFKKRKDLKAKVWIPLLLFIIVMVYYISAIL